MGVEVKDLWDLTCGQPSVDADELAASLEREVGEDDLDFRTQLLIRDSIDALCGFWGKTRVESWLRKSSQGPLLQAMWKLDLGEPGFPTLRRRVAKALRPQKILEILNESGNQWPEHSQVVIGGSVALILSEELLRDETDPDIWDEPPDALRPTGWRDRIRHVGQFGNLDLYLMDSYDIFISMLFSVRRRDLINLRHMDDRLLKQTVEQRLIATASSLRADPQRLKSAKHNWYVLYGEPLPPSTPNP
jgi:hypothetical protein